MATTPIRNLSNTIATPAPTNLVVLDNGTVMGKATLDKAVKAVGDDLYAAQSSLGTAATKDVGTGAGELPDNANVLATAKDGDWTAKVAGAPTRPIYIKLREQVSAFDNMSGALADAIANSGTTSSDFTEITTKINEIIADFGSKGGKLILPAGSYYAKDILFSDRLQVIGEAFGSVVITMPDGVDGQIAYNPGQTTDTAVEYLHLENIIFDGNKSAAPKVFAASVVTVSLYQYLIVKNCAFRNATGYGFGAQAYPGGSFDGPQTEGYLENCYFLDNGDGIGGGADTFDGLDIKYCDKLTLIGCHGVGNSDTGINIRGRDVAIIGGSGRNNGSAGYALTGNQNGNNQQSEIKVFGVDASGNGLSGLLLWSGVSDPSAAIVRASVVGASLHGNVYGLNMPSASQTVRATVSDTHIFDNSGDGVNVNASAARLMIRGCDIIGNGIGEGGGSGIKNQGATLQVDTCALDGNSRYGFEDVGAGSYSIIGGATMIRGNTLGPIGYGSNKRTVVGASVRDYTGSSSDVVASAATVTLPEGGEYFVISGTTSITSITASWRGRRVTLQFAGVLTLTKGSNLALASNFVTSSADTITLVCDGITWLEVARSVN